jgi:recombinational DNA repair ATPase RecF
MKVKRIKVQNVKAIKEQELNLNGATAILMGGNNKGKSTLLRSLKDRLLKMKADQLVRQGETDGLYVMEFTTGDRIEWELSTKTKSGEKLTLISADGSKTSAITEIINWFAPSNFDIDKFLNETPAAQRKTLEKLLGLDFTKLDEKYAVAVEERKDAKRDVERIEIMYKGKFVDENLPTEPEPTEELQKELIGVETHNKAYSLLQHQENELIKRRTEIENQIAELQSRINTVEFNLSELDQKLSDPALQPKNPEYVAELQNKLSVATDQNRKIIENNNFRISLSSLTSLKDIAHEKEMAVKDILEKKDKMIRSANMPEGFGFSEDGITYNGLPLTREQLSSSAIYIAALKLASINVGNVRMLHFDASFLDKNSLDEVRKWAEKEDLQLLIERPDFEAGEIRYEIIEDEWLNS